ncbi:tripartite tricarboxylate transporter permease [Sulfitobacter sp.]|uniref:tripartite tricarboxylate transporter permease n=1 Tax=Sulfitobacter sp. TaxID=1903071 RepID=UPI00300313AA
MSSETVNNASIGDALTPLLVLGIPNSPPAAALMGAFKINNIIPGPTIDPEIILRVVAIMVMASLTMLLFIASIIIKILCIPQTAFLPFVMVLTTIGSVSLGGGNYDLYLMLEVGFVAFFMKLLRYPIAPLVIGVILGGLFDETFCRSLLISEGDLSVFISRPKAAILLTLNVALILSRLPVIRGMFARLRRKVI